MRDSHLTDVQLDRLVDGELPDQEYRQLLAALEDEPGGWRRCALAFLEAQALARELAEIMGPEREEARPVPIPSPGRSRHWPLWLAMAGSFLLAFTLGIVLSGRGRGVIPAVDEPRGVAENANGERAGSTPTDIAAAAAPSEPQPEQRQASDNRGSTVDAAPPLHTPEGVMTFVFEDDGNQMRRVELPYYRYDEREAARWATEGPVVPPDVVRVLRRMGHDLRQRRQLLPVDLDDGSRVVFPMDEVEIVPVSGHGYQ
jgi:hypothetical protein